ncbi:adenine deaminase [Schwartzia sp. (in: firmicutes)]|nr:adenine deaminase [Schwartzia sp. (in: firmicutes)]
MIKDLKRFVRVAQGLEPAELVIKNARVFRSLLGDFVDADIAIDQGHIAGIGEYEGRDYVYADGRYAIPGFIDGHVHIESSMLCPPEFARAVVPLGTTAVITDPHEIANVAGIEGIRYMMESAKQLPLSVYFTLPSCVPATPLEDNGAVLTAEDLEPLLDEPNVLGLAEFMNVPGILNGDDEVYKKLTMRDNLLIEGHAPGLIGKELMAYSAAGVVSDHECVTSEEAELRLAAGIDVEIREGTAATNFEAIHTVINDRTAAHCIFVTDDRHPADLLRRGHINSIVRSAVKDGIPVHQAINMASLSAARHFGLRDRGMIAPRYRADFALYDDLVNFVPAKVFYNGVLVAEEGKLRVSMPEKVPPAILDSVHLASVSKKDFEIPVSGTKANVIGLVPHQLVTEKRVIDVAVKDGLAVQDTARDILKLAVFERHHASGKSACALLQGFGLMRGAIASTVGHDSHNLIVIGADDDDMLAAVHEIERIHGGIAIVEKGKVLNSMPLPIAGIMSTGDAENISFDAEEMVSCARKLGVREEYDPLMTLAFMSLPVIPALKLTDRGLVDVERFEIIPVDAEA